MSLPDVVLLDNALPPIVIEDDAGQVVGIVTDTTGPAGMSAYQLALHGGFVGTEAEWLESLKAAGAIVEHVHDPAPHPAYDDMQDLTLIYENGLI